MIAARGMHDVNVTLSFQVNADRTQLVAKLQGLLDTLQAIPSTNATADALDSLHVRCSVAEFSREVRLFYSVR